MEVHGGRCSTVVPVPICGREPVVPHERAVREVSAERCGLGQGDGVSARGGGEVDVIVDSWEGPVFGAVAG